jgi:hypothetical protein
LLRKVIRAAADALEHTALVKETPNDPPKEPPAGSGVAPDSQPSQTPRKPWPRWKFGLAVLMVGMTAALFALSWPARKAEQARAQAAEAAYQAKHPVSLPENLAGHAAGV